MKADGESERRKFCIYYTIVHGYAPLYLARGEMYLIQHYVIKFVINLLQVLVLIFMDGDVPLVPSFGFDISLLVRFARFYNNVSDFNDNNLVITDFFLHIQRLKGYRFHNLWNT